MTALDRLEKWLRFVLATSLSGKPCWVMRGASLESTLERWEQAMERVFRVRESRRGEVICGLDVVGLSPTDETTPGRHWLLKDLV